MTATSERDDFDVSIPTVMVMKEGPHRDAFILKRGAYDARGDKVSPGLPHVLPPLPAGYANNRLGFARWLVDRSNPLTARVTVNRFWQIFFGVGLVKTAGDFGTQGEWPVYPDVLDWLATEFMDSGWNMKAILKTTDGNVSVHTRKLEEANYLTMKKSFEGRVPRTEYSLTASGRRALERYLDHMEALIKATRAG